MQIQLKQREIVEALKMFIASQGINLTGKTVEIEFTSGRKDNGLSAELTIEDAPVVSGQTIPSGLIHRTIEAVSSNATDTTNSTDETTAIKPSLFK